MAVAVTRLELDASDLRRVATRCRDAKAARRMLALALVLEGHAREAAARHAGMDRQTLRDWVHRYNAEGLAGLRDRPHPGPATRLTPEQLKELATIVANGPDPATDGIVRWRRVRPASRHRAPLRRPAARTSVRSARSCAGSASPACRCAPSTPRAIPKRRQRSKRLPRAGAGGVTRVRHGQADRDLVCR